MITDKIPGARILMVDDEEANLELLQRILEPAGFTNLRSTTRSGDVVEICREWNPDLVLLDIMMPGSDGFEVLSGLGEVVPETQYLPVLVLTSDHTQDAKRRALSSGARDFLTKPLSPAEVRLRVRNLLETRFLHLELHEHNEQLESRVREQTVELEQARLEILQRLARAAEYRDDNTGDHTRRVGETAGAIARALGMEEDEVENIRRVAPLHDVGKIAIPDSILLSSERLDEAMFTVMRTHTTIGADLLGGSGFTLLDLAAEIALSHHEKWNGEGYPAGLARDDIPVSGRIVAVADTFDALTHRRPYKEAWSVIDAWVEIDSCRGGHFDPEVVDAFGTVLEELGVKETKTG